MRDLYWWGYADAGLLGTTAQIGVPSDEQILFVANGIVVSARGTQELGAATLVIRDFDTGSVRREIETAIALPQAVIVGNRLYWSGRDATRQVDDAADSGVWAVEIDGGDPVWVIEPGERIDEMSGRRLLVSPSGKTLIAAVLSQGPTNWVDVIDATSATFVRRIDQIWPWGLTDDTYLMWVHPTDGIALGFAPITAYNLATGKARWSFPDAARVPDFAAYSGFAVGSAFVINYAMQSGDRVERIIAAFDAISGRRTELWRESDAGSDAGLWPMDRLSTDHTVAFAANYGAFLNGPTTVVDLATGVASKDAFEINPPWYCLDDYCFRD